MIKVLVVEDSRVVQELLTHILTSEPQIQVVGIASNGLEALAMAKQKRPDVITMDIHMPTMDGFEATRQIMEVQPTPIVIVSGSSKAKEVAFSFQAIEAGALAVVARPPGINHPGFAAAAQELVQTLKLMSEVKVVTRKAQARKKAPPAALEAVPAPITAREIKIAAIGASTGGPLVLQQILSALPRDLPFPLLIVQHIAKGFTQGFVEWLAGASRFPLRIAAQGEHPRPGYGYVAPEGFHLGVEGGPHIVLSNHGPEHGLRPSISYLFRCVAQAFGPRAVGVLLTGMGSDGAEDLKLMRDRGAVTVAQDKASSVIFGMPGEAIKLEAATHVLPPEGIAALLAALAEQNRRSPQ
ncbi:MAG: chemotaxis-specific protein-glutamate methyltransferase CheB [Desulfarculus sp.]|jgi:two-component system chemotaxis response regulator CheB|nr:MAG: chemotaxis-specific protein-glutamate methyltransferase CheB [Desulfarculus sp.]